MLKRTLIGGALMLLLATQEAGALDDVWFFSATEIEHAFQYQIRYGARLRRPLKSADCVFGARILPLRIARQSLPPRVNLSPKLNAS